MKTRLLEACNRTGRIYFVLKPKFEIDRFAVSEQLRERFDELNVCLFPETLEQQLQSLVDSGFMTRLELEFLKKKVEARVQQPSEILSETRERFLAFKPLKRWSIKKIFEK